MTIPAAVGALIQVTLVIAVAPILTGLMRATRAKLEGRAGPSVVQPWRDIRKLLHKERIKPEYSGWVFLLAPRVLLASGLMVVVLVPLITTATALGGSGDLFAVVYLVLLGTVFLVLAGLDPGTAFGGMGASRAITVAALAEPAFLLAIFALSVRAGSSSLATIVDSVLAEPRSLASPGSLLALAAVSVVVLAESGRLPVDNPSTHLELTMIHESMVLEYAGPDLAVVELASQVRLTIFLGLIANLFAPWGIAVTTHPADLAIGTGVVVAKLALLGVVIATFEVFVAKMRLFRVPELLTAAFILAFLAITMSFFLT